MPQKILMVLLVTLTTNALAFRGRPLTPMTFNPVTGELAAQQGLTLAAGPDGYLAAWFERGTVRATRIDSGGNPLDGEGIVLGSAPSAPMIAIDGNGPHWFVVWCQNGPVRARSIPYRGGTPGPIMEIGTRSSTAFTTWNGDHYLVLYSNEQPTVRTVSPDGTLGPPVDIAVPDRLAFINPPPHYENSTRQWPSALVRFQDRVLAMINTQTRVCRTTASYPTSSCWEELKTFWRSVAPDAPPPFLEMPGTYSSIAAVAASRTHLVELLYGDNGVYGRFAAGTSYWSSSLYPMSTRGVRGLSERAPCAVTSDGTEFTVTCPNQQGDLITARMTKDAEVIRQTTLPRAHGFILGVGDAAASTALPALMGFTMQDGQRWFPDRRRAMLLFESEWHEPPPLPPAPSIRCVTRNDDGASSVEWEPVPDTFATSVELLRNDGTSRTIAIALANATTARVALATRDDDAVRIRAWNAGGLSAPSATLPIVSPPAAILRSAMRACAGVPAEVSVTLTGTPPFTVHWSDGVVQKNLQARTASRTITPTRDTTLSIVTVEDRSCAANRTRESIRIDVDAAASIAAQSREVRVRANETAALSVTARGATDYAWYEGVPGDTSRRVGMNLSTFTTAPLTRATQYWVRVSNRCGSADSAAIDVSVDGKRRATRH